MESTLPEILMVRDTLIFLLQHLDLVINLQKSVFYPVKQIEFLGLVIDIEKMNLAFSVKTIKRVSTMSGDFHPTKNLSIKSHKINWYVVINFTDQFISTNSVSISSTGGNINSTKKGSYSGHVTLENLAREELLWWMENLKICNGRKIQQ